MNHAYSTAQMAQEADDFYCSVTERGYHEDFYEDKNGIWHARGGRFASEKEVKAHKRREQE